MIYITIYMIIGMIIAAVALSLAARALAKDKKYHWTDILLVCFLFAIALPLVWPMVLWYLMMQRRMLFRR
ncbi:hypothetical protein ACM1RC_30335 [Paenibacillus azoreducens]|uniref:hypothetical protein n=1 Tax=Paenibacillus azoreducens TaxID=116718 RepID=UPI0039F602DC